jgi:hypothetical protein
LAIAYCLLPIAYCQLPIACAYCPLPIAYCLLPIAYCLLPVGYSLWPETHFSRRLYLLSAFGFSFQQPSPSCPILPGTGKDHSDYATERRLVAGFINHKRGLA